MEEKIKNGMTERKKGFGHSFNFSIHGQNFIELKRRAVGALLFYCIFIALSMIRHSTIAYAWINHTFRT